MKTCTKCRETKPLDAFVADKRRRDGKGAHCKACQREREKTPEDRALQRKYRQTPEYRARRHKYEQTPEYKARQRKRRQTPESKAYQREYRQTPEYKALHPKSVKRPLTEDEKDHWKKQFANAGK